MTKCDQRWTSILLAGAAAGAVAPAPVRVRAAHGGGAVPPLPAAQPAAQRLPRRHRDRRAGQGAHMPLNAAHTKPCGMLANLGWMQNAIGSRWYQHVAEPCAGALQVPLVCRGAGDFSRATTTTPGWGHSVTLRLQAVSAACRQLQVLELPCDMPVGCLPSQCAGSSGGHRPGSFDCKVYCWFSLWRHYG